MEYDRIKAYAADSMKTIYAFCLTRLGHREEAEDLASEILVRVLSSANSIRDEQAFYGFLWRIARNTYIDYLRRRTHTDIPLDASIPDDAPSVEDTVADEMELQENQHLIRRELSLLSEHCRRAVVLYYMEHNNCTQIADKLNISTDMVKYYLFRARKLILEGMHMTRIYGEKSYRPKEFEIDFWGTHGGLSEEYRAFRSRKIKGNILVAAYYSPITAQELSMELGVALPYLEDEITLLMERRYLTKKNGKYLSNIPIFTEECTAAIDEALKAMTAETARTLRQLLEQHQIANTITAASAVPFPRENDLYWQLITLCCANNLTHYETGYDSIIGDYDPDSPYALLDDHACGIIWGRCVNAEIIQSRMHGISHNAPASDGRGILSTFNFWQMAEQQTVAFEKGSGISTDAVVCAATGNADMLPKEQKQLLNAAGYTVNGQPNFPIYTKEHFAQITTALADAYAVMDDYIYRVRETAASVTADHAPEHIRETAQKVGAFVYSLRGYEAIVDALFDAGFVKAPEGTYIAVQHADFFLTFLTECGIII